MKQTLIFFSFIHLICCHWKEIQLILRYLWWSKGVRHFDSMQVLTNVLRKCFGFFFLHNPSVKARKQGNDHKPERMQNPGFHVIYQRKPCLSFLLCCFLMLWWWHALLPTVERSHVVFGYARALQRELYQSFYCRLCKANILRIGFPSRNYYHGWDRSHI